MRRLDINQGCGDEMASNEWRLLWTKAAASVLLIMLLFGAADVMAAKKPEKMAPKIPPGKPEIFQLEPRGIERGYPVKLKLIGTNLIGVTEVKFQNADLSGEVLEEPVATTNVLWIEISAAKISPALRMRSPSKTPIARAASSNF